MNKFIVLFVCTGNTCRSPMAEGILKELVLDETEKKGRNIPVLILSAGIFAEEGMAASKGAMDACAGKGINLKFHRSKRLDPEMVESADLILTMGKMHTRFVETISPMQKNIYELKNFARKGNVVSSEIMDPAGGAPEIYLKVFREIESEIRRISPDIFSLISETENAD